MVLQGLQTQVAVVVAQAVQAHFQVALAALALSSFATQAHSLMLQA
jgi:hypothetical protein